ncbi:hypothetical protein ARMGADRAFT_1115754 [Armillaria gallica]|uniref:Uncharacterized protein n=1 Tax=Armillaria gallica TaxID=47427 RepID=A0A2H3CZS5_ARMGA|nr:hypothetical protein ARMGADRAFT_1115754 [Armillaria gallica]
MIILEEDECTPLKGDSTTPGALYSGERLPSFLNLVDLLEKAGNPPPGPPPDGRKHRGPPPEEEEENSRGPPDNEDSRRGDGRNKGVSTASEISFRLKSSFLYGPMAMAHLPLQMMLTETLAASVVPSCNVCFDLTSAKPPEDRE